MGRRSVTEIRDAVEMRDPDETHENDEIAERDGRRGDANEEWQGGDSANEIRDERKGDRKRPKLIPVVFVGRDGDPSEKRQSAADSTDDVV